MRYLALVLFVGCILSCVRLCDAQDSSKSVPSRDSKSKTPPTKGDKAPDAEWKTLDGKKITLQEMNQKGPVVVVVLRGYPGYQCPICTQQVSSLVGSAKQFAEKKANVVLVYPGAAKNLNSKAKEFLRNSTLPANFQLVLDPGYAFVDAYGLRWDAPGETAYPSTFVVGSDGRVVYDKISRSHGDRSDTAKVISSL